MRTNTHMQRLSHSGDLVAPKLNDKTEPYSLTELEQTRVRKLLESSLPCELKPRLISGPRDSCSASLKPTMYASFHVQALLKVCGIKVSEVSHILGDQPESGSAWYQSNIHSIVPNQDSYELLIGLAEIVNIWRQLEGSRGELALVLAAPARPNFKDSIVCGGACLVLDRLESVLARRLLEKKRRARFSTLTL